MSETRIVLVKPGDVLMLGNVTIPEDTREAFHEALRTLKETLGLTGDILVFQDDVDLAVKPGESESHYHAHFGTATSADYARAVRDAADRARVGERR